MPGLVGGPLMRLVLWSAIGPWSAEHAPVKHKHEWMWLRKTWTEWITCSEFTWTHWNVNSGRVHLRRRATAAVTWLHQRNKRIKFQSQKSLIPEANHVLNNKNVPKVSRNLLADAVYNVCGIPSSILEQPTSDHRMWRQVHLHSCIPSLFQQWLTYQWLSMTVN